MKKHKYPVLFWTPRTIIIVFAVFISLFAFDVFNDHQGFSETATALLIHLIPTAVIIISLIIAWKWELFGGLFYITLGIFYITWAWG